MKKGKGAVSRGSEDVHAAITAVSALRMPGRLWSWLKQCKDGARTTLAWFPVPWLINPQTPLLLFIPHVSMMVLLHWRRCATCFGFPVCFFASPREPYAVALRSVQHEPRGSRLRGCPDIRGPGGRIR